MRVAPIPTEWFASLSNIRIFHDHYSVNQLSVLKKEGTHIQRDNERVNKEQQSFE